MKYAFVHEHREVWPVAVQCGVLGVSRGGYYGWVGRPPSARAARREALASEAREVFAEHKGRYGAPRVHAELARRGVGASLNTVAGVMRDAGLRARPKPRFVPKTTDSAHATPVAGNLLGRDFSAEAPGRKWVADITYVPTGEGWLYLAAVMDLYSRKVVGWSMGEGLDAELCLDAMSMALGRCQHGAGLLHHSDRGVQYASEAYRELLAREGMVASMSGKADCYDNAAMESFWATLKTELTHRERYATKAEARASIFEYIEVYYNRKRLHSALGYKSPEAYEAENN